MVFWGSRGFIPKLTLTGSGSYDLFDGKQKVSPPLWAGGAEVDIHHLAALSNQLPVCLR